MISLINTNKSSRYVLFSNQDGSSFSVASNLVVWLLNEKPEKYAALQTERLNFWGGTVPTFRFKGILNATV